MLTMEFDYDKLADALVPKLIERMKEDIHVLLPAHDLPPLLTRTQMMELLHISSWKATELFGRPDFPVFREAGLLIPTKKLFEWIDRHTQWVEENTNYFNVV